MCHQLLSYRQDTRLSLPVYTVEKVDDDDGRRFESHFVEADDVAEVDGHFVELLGFYSPSSLQLDDHLLRQHLK